MDSLNELRACMYVMEIKTKAIHEVTVSAVEMVEDAYKMAVAGRAKECEVSLNEAVRLNNYMELLLKSCLGPV